ncbi:trimeric intracellular cation channel family protein [Siansivirga zeaxanthinifaciens]|uniref:Glycine transporter domain-containing protein n=1 Tax=Siansivirga zeaxanthinifaciens CC-SAMT-1 TaxID=1454006 RepID=A0A0C5W9G9_9FLAO|nr:trimeric intracellular cation channel family protein [Siansivirga zeaxanthinifaciens]AJR03753.1 hypothetical protein AW14_09105 [Siansivirga zeaxanthinifaciens CC-SAMT-1]
MFYIIDILGTISFAISGVLIAMDKKMDVFGILIIAFVTAAGGGTLRDLLLGNTPVGWMKDITFVYLIIASTIVAIIFKSKLGYLRTSLFLFDTIGIGLYTLIGIEKGVNAGMHPLICIALGTITASFGGVIRDILCNEIPIIFRKEIYATACILGGFTYFLLSELPIPGNIVFLFSGAIVIITRLLAVKFKIALPSLYPAEK